MLSCFDPSSIFRTPLLLYMQVLRVPISSFGGVRLRLTASCKQVFHQISKRRGVVSLSSKSTYFPFLVLSFVLLLLLLASEPKRSILLNG